MTEVDNKSHPMKEYIIDVRNLYAVITVDAVSYEDALYAGSEGWGDIEIIWDDAEYSEREEQEHNE